MPAATSGQALWLRAATGYLGLSQEETAVRLEVAVRTVRRWECGASPVPLDALDAVDEWIRESAEDVVAATRAATEAGVVDFSRIAPGQPEAWRLRVYSRTLDLLGWGHERGSR